MFKKGDLVIGNDSNYYSITAEGTLCLVIEDENEFGEIYIKLIKPYKNHSIGVIDNLGYKARVYANRFNLFE